MARTSPLASAPPRLVRRGYAVFVKLCELSAETSADEAHALFAVLDRLLTKMVRNDKNSWFPSPYGAAVVVPRSQTALDTARAVVQQTAEQGICVSVGIAYGSFQRVHSVTSWNCAALALNMAARMASNPKTKGAVSVDPKTKKDAVSARKGVRSLFGPLREGKVKRTVFQYHEIVNSQYVQKIDKPAKLQLRKRKTRLADVVLFDIEKYSEQPQPKQAKLADSLSRCVEFALADLGAKPCYGPAGDGGYLAFLADESEGSNIAFSFARNLRDQAKDEEVPIRIGIASGPIASSDDRPILGGVVLEADSVSSHASPGEIAVTRDFWEHQPVQLRYGWDTKSEIADHSIFLIHQPEIIAQAVTEIDNVLSDAPPIYVRTVLISMQKKERLEIPLTYFRERGIKTIATPNTAQYIRSLGFDCVTTFDYTKSPPLLTARGSLHPYILMAIAASAADEEKITSLRALGLGSIDLVFVNTSDPIISEDMTRRELMEQIAAVQIGGPSLVRWTLKQWMTAAAVVSPDDYGLLVNDLKRNNDRLSSEMRLVLLRQAMGYLARKDLKTSRLFGLLWSRV